MLAQDLDTFRQDLRSWLAANVPDDLRGGAAARLADHERVPKLRAWQRKLAEARWVGISWPEEFGGRGAGIGEQIVYVEEKGASCESPGHSSSGRPSEVPLRSACATAPSGESTTSRRHQSCQTR